MRNLKKGFTLIELLVVIAIIGILASIVLASLDGSRKRGRDARRISDVKQVQLALELYYDQNNAFPPSISNTAGSCGQASPGSCSSLYLTGPGYISVVPGDPSNNRDYDYVPYYATGGSTSVCVSYHLGTALETQGHSALISDKDMAAQSGASGQPFGVCTAQYSAAAADFNSADTGKCINGASADYGSYCYDVIP